SAEARRAEVAIRVAMGASRGRLVRQLLTESAVVSILAGAAGVLLAWWLVRLIPALIPAMPISFTFDFRIDRRVLAYTLTVALAAAPLFGLVPALVASRPDLTPLMKGGPSGRLGFRRVSLRRLLVVGEVAVAFVLLIASGLFVRSFIAARGIDPGFTPRPMIFSTFAPPVIGYSEAQSREFYAALLTRVEGVPGIERASMVRHLPLNMLSGRGATYEIHVPGHDESPNNPIRTRYNVVETSYFETMGVPIVEGRAFDASDRGNGPAVAIVNQTMARGFWKGANPIGQYFTIVRGQDATRECRVVGVARDGKYLHINEAPQPYFYVPFAQQFSGEMTVVARYRGEAGPMAAAFRREIQALDPAMPTLQILTLDEHLRLALFAERLLAALMGTLGGLGLLLSVVGLYGIVSHAVARRRREIGIRIAVGASPWQVVRGVLADGGRLTAVGLVLGVLLAIPCMKVAERLLNGISPRDPLVYGVVVLLVLAVALGATWAPARRAARVDPVSALRAE
ncbi:MAG: FtsX-like permease family protein, partial [Acidobacteria bacterium]